MTRAGRHTPPVTGWLRAYPTLIRWQTCLSASALFVLGSHWQGGRAGLLSVAVGAAAAWMSVAQAEILNDVVDRGPDSIDKPDRPIPSGVITVRSALLVYGATAVASLLLGFLVSGELGVSMAALVAASALYCTVLKSTVLVGNALVSAMSSVPFLLGAHNAAALHPTALLAGLLISLFMFSFELVKTARDVVGDSAAGLTTVGTVYGVRVALRWAVAAFVADCGVALALACTARRGLAFGSTFAVLVALPVLRRSMTAWSARNPSPADAAGLFRTLRRLWKYGMLCLVLLV